MATFKESELILTPEGRIYHLNLLPHEIADTVITVGDPERVPLVSRHFDHIEVKQRNRELVTHTGTLQGKRLTVLSTGMGTGNIDIVLNELDALRNIDFETRTLKPHIKPLNLIHIGTTGALQETTPVDSPVFSEAALGFDSLLHFYNFEETAEEQNIVRALSQYFQGELPVMPYCVSVSRNFSQRFSDIAYYKGITATCSGFYAPQGRLLRAQPRLHDFVDKLAMFSYQHQYITNFDMETAAIYGLSRLLGFNYCSLSLVVANRAAGTFSRNAGPAMNQLIEQTLQKLVA